MEAQGLGKKGASQEKVPRMSKFHGVGDHDDMVLVTMMPRCWSKFHGIGDHDDMVLVTMLPQCW